MSNEIISDITQTLALLTLASHIGFFVILAIFAVHKFYGEKVTKTGKIIRLIEKHRLSLAFLVAAPAVLASLYLSEIAKFPPCSLCWYQRIFLYPQAIILGIALLKNDHGIKKYIIPLSVFGLVFALYQYWLQMSPLPITCTTDSISCSDKQVLFFNYITIPLMSATSFLLLLGLMLFPQIHSTFFKETNHKSIAKKAQISKKKTGKKTNNSSKSTKSFHTKTPRSRRV